MLVIGNGQSRSSIDLSRIKDTKIGCNAIFRDEKVWTGYVSELLIKKVFKIGIKTESGPYGGENNIQRYEINNKYFLEWSKQNDISLAVCTNKQEHLAIDLLKKIKIFDYFEYVAGSNTFDYCKPDPRHLTSVIEILQGDIKKSLMIGDSETDSAAANSANLPFILLEDGYTDKKVNEIPHDHLVTNFQGIEKIVSKYLNT